MSDDSSFTHPFATSLLVKLRFDNVADLKRFYTRDISKEGIFLVAEQPKEVGTKVQLNLLSPEGKEILQLSGVVVRTVTADMAREQGLHAGMGIHFEDLTKSRRRDLAEAIIDLEEEMKSKEAPIIPEAPLPEESERRKEQRFQKALTVKLNIPDIQHFTDFVNREIEKGEVFIRTNIPSSMGQPVNVLINPPMMEKEIRLQAEVISITTSEEATLRGGNPGVLIRLVDMDSNKKQFMNNLLEALRKKAYFNVIPQEPEKPDNSVAMGFRGGAAISTIPPDRHINIIFEFEGDFTVLFQKDISNGAIFISTPEPLPVMSRLTISINAPEIDEELELLAEVVRVVTPSQANQSGTQPGMGLSFLDLEDDLKSSLRAKLGLPELSKKAPMPMPTPARSTPPLDPGYVRPIAKSADEEHPSSAYSETRNTSSKPEEEETQAPHEAVLNEEQLDNTLRRLEKAFQATLYDVFGVPTDAPDREIQVSYRQLIAMLHPDKYRNKISLALHDRLEALILKLQAALDTLADTNKRATYDITNNIKHVIMREQDVNARLIKQQRYREEYVKKFPDKVNQAEMIMKDAMKSIQDGKLLIAISSIKLALSFDPLNNRYKQILLGLEEKYKR